MDKKNLLTRTVSATVYVVILLLAIFGGTYFFVPIFGIILAFALHEFYRMVEKNTPHTISKALNIISGVIIFISAYLYITQVNSYIFGVTSLGYLLILFASAILINRKDIFQTTVYSIFGQVYITLPFCLLMLIAYQFNESNTYTYALILSIFVFMWVNDTAAYLFGSMLGKHRLIERISPKKSIEGFIAGLFFAIIAGYVFSYFYTDYTQIFWMGFALVAALFGTLGDLFESLIKRNYEVKDSGHLIPGHGGILDRIDSLLLAIPAVYLYLLIVLKAF